MGDYDPGLVPGRLSRPVFTSPAGTLYNYKYSWIIAKKDSPIFLELICEIGLDNRPRSAGFWEKATNCKFEVSRQKARTKGVGTGS